MCLKRLFVYFLFFAVLFGVSIGPFYSFAENPDPKILNTSGAAAADIQKGGSSTSNNADSSNKV